MQERIDKIDTLLADVAALLVERYGMTPRDATGLVMKSSVARQLYTLQSSLEDSSKESIVDMLLAV